MAVTNHGRVGKALELLRDGLRPFIEREVKAHGGGLAWFEEIAHLAREAGSPAEAQATPAEAQATMFG